MSYSYPSRKKQRKIMQNIDNTEVDDSFFEENEVTDIALVIEDKNLYVSKAVMSTVSPVFRKMFLSGFREKGAKELPLHGKKYKDVLEFLKTIYPNILKPFNISTLTMVLPLLHEYDCQRQLQEAKNFINTNITPGDKTIPVDILLEYLLQSHLYGLTKSYIVCLDSTSQYCLKNIKSSIIFQKFPDVVKADLFEKRLEQFETFGEEIYREYCYGYCNSGIQKFKTFLDNKNNKEK